MIDPIRNGSSQTLDTSAPDFTGALSQQDDDGIILGQIKKDDPRIVEFQKLVAEKKKTQALLPEMVDVVDPEKQAEAFGRTLTKTKGGQIVVIGESHDATDQWLVFEKIIEEFEKTRDEKDNRRIIIFDESLDGSDTGSVWREWNETPIAKRGLLGQEFLKADGQSSEESYSKFYTRASKNNPTAVTAIPLVAGLDRITSIRPDANFYNIDSNHTVVNGADKSKYDMNYASRDTMMALNIDNLRKQFPDAIFIGHVGAQHAIKAMQDNPAIKNNISGVGSDRDNPFAEKLAKLYGPEIVHSINAEPIGSEIENSSSENILPTAPLFDLFMPVKQFDSKNGWTNPWKNASPLNRPHPVIQDTDAKNDLIILDQMRNDDSLVRSFEKRIQDSTKNPIPADAGKAANPLDASKILGKSLADSKGGQIVLFDANSKIADQWNVLVGTVEAFEAARKDKRPVIFVMDENTRSTMAAGARLWNRMTPAERKETALGDVIVGAMHYSSKEDYEKKILSQIKGDPAMKINGKPSYRMWLPFIETLNRLSQLNPDMNIMFGMNNDYAKIMSFKNDDDDMESKFNTDYADIDTSMALNIKRLHDKNPDAVIFGLLSNASAAERVKDDPQNARNIHEEWGNNLNDPCGEQLSLLLGDNVVHSVRVMTPGNPLIVNAKGDDVYTNFNQFDQIIYIQPYDSEKGWKKSW